MEKREKDTSDSIIGVFLIVLFFILFAILYSLLTGVMTLDEYLDSEFEINMVEMCSNVQHCDNYAIQPRHEFKTGDTYFIYVEVHDVLHFESSPVSHNQNVDFFWIIYDSRGNVVDSNMQHKSYKYDGILPEKKYENLCTWYSHKIPDDWQGNYTVEIEIRDNIDKSKKSTKTHFYVKKEDCPFDCCILEPEYEDKSCHINYRCENHKCIEGEQNCPYLCCSDNEKYPTKKCEEGYKCINHECTSIYAVNNKAKQDNHTNATEDKLSHEWSIAVIFAILAAFFAEIFVHTKSISEKVILFILIFTITLMLIKIII